MGRLGGRLFTRAALIKTRRPALTQIHVVLNWFEELNRRVPVR